MIRSARYAAFAAFVALGLAAAPALAQNEEAPQHAGHAHEAHAAEAPQAELQGAAQDEVPSAETQAHEQDESAPEAHRAGEHHAAPAAHGAASGHDDHHGAAAAHGGGHDDHGPKDINWFDFDKPKQPPYIAYVINFGILMWIFVRFGKGPVLSGLKERRNKVKREIDEAQRMKKEAAARAKKYQKQLENLDEELDATKKALIAAAATDKERIVREAEEKAARMERDAKSLLESEVKQTRLDLTRETADLAMSAAEELLRSRITRADQERLAEDFLHQLAARGTGSRPTPSGPPASPSGGSAGPRGPASSPPLAQTRESQ